MLDKLPGVANIPAAAKQQINDKELARLEAIINSMTVKERQRPDMIKGSRKKRISAGCGMQILDVYRLLKQFAQMQKMMKKMNQKGGMAKMMRGLGGKFPMGGGMPF
jgi:signal recognition particle subunit SRP54